MQATPTVTEPQTFSMSDLSVKHVRFALMIVMVLLTAIAAVVFLTNALAWREQPFLGVLLNHTATVNGGKPNSSTSWTGKDAGLRMGDQIETINDLPIANNHTTTLQAQNYNDVLSNLTVGERVTVGFKYDPVAYPTPRQDNIVCAEPNADGTIPCLVSYELMAFPDSDFIAFFLSPYLTGVVVLISTIILIALRPLYVHTFNVTLVLVPMSLAMMSIFSAGTSHHLAWIWVSSMTLTGVSMIMIGLLFPRPVPFFGNSIFAQMGLLAIGALCVGFVLNNYASSPRVDTPPVYSLSTAFAIVTTAIFLSLLVAYHRRVAFTRQYYDQTNILILGTVLGLVPAILWIIGRVVGAQSLLSVTIEISLSFLIVLAFSMIYAVLHRGNKLDTDNMLNQAITYTILLVALGIGYGLLLLSTTLFVTDRIIPNNPLLIVITIFFVSVLFIPVRTRLQSQIDRIYYRERYDYQALLEQFNQKLTSTTGINILITEFRELLDKTIHPVNTLIFLRNSRTGEYVAYGDPVPETDITFNENSGVVHLLNQAEDVVYLEPNKSWPPELHIDKARLGIIRVMVLAGMTGDNILNGFVAISPPRSNRIGYHYEELRFVRNLIGALSIAIERAFAINSLENSVREMEVLSQVSQAVNFTVDTEDLLELLYAQTLKISKSPYFYIVLQDKRTSELYYAFFLEDDERHTQIEGHKWTSGNDLYSDIIRTGQPLRLTNYTAELTKRGYTVKHESADIHAWMGIPLMAGSTILGVMAIGNNDLDAIYSNDQFRTINDIAALAASTLDKSRLFAEATERARQLAALNDISRQLVATEGDIERLLDVVTVSAADILNAEAGSLLLTTEDGSGDLEFHVATGETGQELIGKRLQRGHGLVGRVAETGKPIISNDTTQDSNWQGEVSEGFRTRSILAVPLIAQDRVIGVLEVINKRDGSIYVDEDVELLTTFAGQAAIAFENARLFQQTDLQLSRRVQELESLERIDRELNRTLDLNSVAEITVRYAISNSNATAGLLVVPDENKSFLRIVAKQGYSPDDNPRDGTLWSVSDGIISRVLRTRRADLQPYVDMDPDYIPSLSGSLSQITVPMVAGSEISAILVLETNQEPRLNLLDQDWAQRLAEHASIAIENAKLYEQISHANETKSEFIGFAAHELKNPLTSVKGYAETLTSSMVTMMTPDQIKQFAGIIQNNAERMNGIISDLRDIAKDDAGKLTIALEPVELRQVVMDTLISLQKQIDSKNQTVINEIHSNLPPVLGDRSRLTQIMVNFLSNAHKYSPEGAEIRLEAQVVPRYITRRGKNLGTVMHIRVIDSGIGMSQDTLSRLFTEDYFRSDNKEARSQEGTGLGMIITKRLIEGHNGDVWVESEIGKGSTFHFIVPIYISKTDTQEIEPLIGGQLG
jgi:signal transduction histidine kinase